MNICSISPMLEDIIAEEITFDPFMLISVKSRSMSSYRREIYWQDF